MLISSSTCNQNLIAGYYGTLDLSGRSSEPQDPRKLDDFLKIEFTFFNLYYMVIVGTGDFDQQIDYTVNHNSSNAIKPCLVLFSTVFAVFKLDVI